MTAPGPRAETGPGAAPKAAPPRDVRVMVMLGALAAVNLALGLAIVWGAYVAAPADPALPRAVPDFAAFWAAAAMTLEGRPAMAYDWAAHKAVEAAALGFAPEGWMAWHYPPSFQLLVTPLGAMPVWPAMMLWVGLTLAVYLVVCWRILPGVATLLAALGAAPTALILVNGQTGFLLAAALGVVLLALDRRPWLAGVALGLLSVKPQLGLALPVALVAGGRWRVLGLGVAVTLALAGAAWLVLGGETWEAFRISTTTTADRFAGVDARWEIFGSLYGTARFAGLGFWPAMAAHAVAALAVVVALWVAWRRPLPAALKAALLAFATAAVTPRILNYDLHILVIGALFQVRHAREAGWFRGEAVILGAVMVAGFLSILVPPGIFGVAAKVMFWACWAGHVRGASTGPAGRGSIAPGPTARPAVPTGDPPC